MATARASGRRRPLAWAAAAFLLVISVLHLAAASVGDPLHSPIALIWASLGVVGLVTAARFVTSQCFESRLGMVFVGSATLVAVLLLHTVGAPGAARTDWSPRDLLLAALSGALLASWRVTARAPRD